MELMERVIRECALLQEANKLLAGEGHGHLQNRQKMVRARQQYMVAQVSALYPVKASMEQSSGVTVDVNGSESGDRAGLPSSNLSKISQRSSFTIFGLHLSTPPLKKTSFFGDKKELQRSATALGYVAHAVMLIAAFLDVPLRYPLRFGGSRSYIVDHAPSNEFTSSDLASNSLMAAIPKPMEFPLFLEGQDSTRSAYAIFLLNKDVEQLLNYIGAQSLGPRHVLPNLKELMKIIQAEEYIDK
uniref:UV radiation resistance-associated gene protein n=1 Tax=Anthurium amnicola TaxID=1678845 RepID=A0A1D1XP16_9ARAE